jgi:hypothetical protein
MRAVPETFGAAFPVDQAHCSAVARVSGERCMENELLRRHGYTAEPAG